MLGRVGKLVALVVIDLHASKQRTPLWCFLTAAGKRQGSGEGDEEARHDCVPVCRSLRLREKVRIPWCFANLQFPEARLSADCAGSS